jgi:ADP-heptose:LPS heptosyltransferase
MTAVLRNVYTVQPICGVTRSAFIAAKAGIHFSVASAGLNMDSRFHGNDGSSAGRSPPDLMIRRFRMTLSLRHFCGVPVLGLPMVSKAPCRRPASTIGFLKPNRILLIQSRWMGDVLLCTPAVRALRRAFPAAHLAFLAEPPGAAALEGNPDLDEIIPIEKGWASALRVQQSVRAGRFDVVVDFRSTGSTARIVALSRAPVRIGIRGRGPRNLAYTSLLGRNDGAGYMAREKLRLLGSLGIDAETEDLRLRIALGCAERARAARLWDKHGLDGQRVVAISPVSRTRYKQWGAERWAMVADALVESGVPILLTSGPTERAQVQAVIDHMHQPVVSDCSATSVHELGALYERCALWAGNDGGLKHVAAATGTPTVAVCRWRQSQRWSDPGAGSGQYALEAPPLQGCDLRCAKCSHLGCLMAVSVQSVFEAVRGALANSPAEYLRAL